MTIIMLNEKNKEDLWDSKMNRIIKNIFFVAIAVIFLASCQKDKAVVLPNGINGNLVQLEMGSEYEYQFFVNLETKQTVYTSIINNWDLSFSSEANSSSVFINGGKAMAVYQTDETDFTKVNQSDTAGELKWNIDDLKTRTSVFGDCFGDAKLKDKIFIVKLKGVGKYRKIKFKSVSNFQYEILVGDINSTEPVLIKIEKDPAKNFSYFSFDLLKQVQNIEPDKTTWDIQFTRYGEKFIDNNKPLLYVVTGVISNPYKTLAYKDSLNSYENINESFLNQITFNNSLTNIGHDWKFYDFNLNQFTIPQNYNYIVKDQKENYYRLRFLDFYNDKGVKGSPQFEYTQIK
ncbi:MAG: HmuY family protein [Chitinophagaceae bacterium]|nr:HmuY family protein [Chitinophagaceae bacterium]